MPLLGAAGKPAAAQLVCARCGAIQPPAAASIRLLRRPRPARHPAVDRAELERRYYALSRELHPDRFQTGRRPSSARERRATALLNQRLPDAPRRREPRPLLAGAARRALGTRQQPRAAGARGVASSRCRRSSASCAARRGRSAAALRRDARRRTRRDRRRVRERARRVDAALRATGRDDDRRGAGAAPVAARAEVAALASCSYLRTLRPRSPTGASRTDDGARSSESTSARRTASWPSWTTTAPARSSRIRRPARALLPSAVSLLPDGAFPRRRERARRRADAAPRELDPVRQALHGPRRRARRCRRPRSATASPRTGGRSHPARSAAAAASRDSRRPRSRR